MLKLILQNYKIGGIDMKKVLTVFVSFIMVAGATTSCGDTSIKEESEEKATTNIITEEVENEYENKGGDYEFDDDELVQEEEHNKDVHEYSYEAVNDYSGVYSGASGKTTLILDKDYTCTYDEYGTFKSVHFEGVYSFDDETETINIELNKDGDMLYLFADIKEDGSLYINSNNEKWSPELFIKA